MDSEPQNKPDRNPAARLKQEWRQLTTIRESNRPWLMPFAAGMAIGIPLLIGAHTDQMEHATIASLGGLVFLHLQETSLQHRMVHLMACGFGMIACYALGLASQLVPELMMLSLTIAATLVTMVCRFYRLGPPGSLFFIMAAAIGAYTPARTLAELPLRVGLFTMGCLCAGLVAFVYSLHTLHRRAAEPVVPTPPARFDFVVFDSIIIGVAVGQSLLAAQLIGLEKAYWVPVSCLAVIQGMNLRAVWERQLHRILGTSIGLVLSWGLLSLPLDLWRIAGLIIVLVFIVETAIVRHYAFAAIFITPLTIMLGDAATLQHDAASELALTRFFDTVVGSLIGLAGGVALHSPGFRRRAGPPLRRMVSVFEYRQR
jgi:uncharacterized membrane protein YccC